MLAQARRQAPGVRLVEGDALALPFADAAFERVFTSFFYGHLDEPGRERFLDEARRVADELVVVEGADGADRPTTGPAGSDGHVPRHDFDAADLASELGGRVLHEGRRFVVVAA